jgi:Arc/MetJ family transcription regulator
MTMTESPVKPDLEPELDEELLAEAMRQAETSSRNAAINAALLEFVEAKRGRRLQAFDNLQRMADEGAFNFEALEEAEK